MSERNIGRAIDKMRIPDDDVPGWIGTLREGGFSDEEIDWIIANLNTEYAERSGVLDRELEAEKERFAKKFGRTMTRDQEEYYKKGIRQRFGIEDNPKG